MVLGKKLQNILVTVDDWFQAPDGDDYKVVYGDAVVRKAEDILGFMPEKSANWILDFGDVIIMGCQIHYVSVCPGGPPNRDKGRKSYYESKPINSILNS